MKALRDEIDRRNADRPAEEQLSKGGSKAVLCERLLEDDSDVPALPWRRQGWDPLTEEWWEAVWSSPMSNEWHLETDYYNVLAAAMHYDDMWCAEKAADRQKADTLFMKRVAALGLTPYDRRRLEWEIENAETAKERGRKRRTGADPAPAPTPKPAEDPRLRLVGDRR